MNYNEMSDFEINKVVAEALNKSRGDGSELEAMFAESLSNSAENGRFNPCNNPNDAWPIIVESSISVCPWKDPMWHSYSSNTKIRHPDKNPLRAAMIVYLKMKGVL